MATQKTIGYKVRLFVYMTMGLYLLGNIMELNQTEKRL